MSIAETITKENIMTTKAQDIQNNLSQFHCTEKYHRSSAFSRKHAHTDGIQYLAQEAGCYWLLDIVTSVYILLKDESFQLWKVKRNGDGITVICEDGNSNVLYTQEVEYSDFPLDDFEFYCELGSLNGIDSIFIIMLKTER